MQYDDLDYSIEVTTAAGKPVVKDESLKNPETTLLKIKVYDPPQEQEVEYKGQIISATRQYSTLATYKHTSLPGNAEYVAGKILGN